MAIWQRADGLPIEPTRLYYEISLHWIFWYIGVPAVLFGTLGAALLARRCLRGRAPLWTLPLMSFAWTIVATLYRPGITPDQPWASRRLVPACCQVSSCWPSGPSAGSWPGCASAARPRGSAGRRGPVRGRAGRARRHHGARAGPQGPLGLARPPPGWP